MSAPDVSQELFRAVAALAEEVWILRDRQRVTEAVLARHGLDLREEIERFEPDAELARALDAERRAFIAAVLRPFGASRSAPNPY